MGEKETWQERKAREKAEERIVATTLPAVADLLGATIGTREGGTIMIYAPDYTVYCYHDTWKSRLRLSGSFDPDLHRHRIQGGSQADPVCAISVDVHRPAKDIARDIERRLAPLYRQLHKTFTERNARYVAGETAKQDQAQRIVHAGRGEQIGERDPWRRHDFYPTRYVLIGGGRFTNSPSGEVEITGIDKPSISMKLYNLTPELAEYIASLLGEWAEE